MHLQTHCFPRASSSVNCSHRGTDKVQRQSNIRAYFPNIPQLKLKLAVSNHVTEELSAEIVTVPTRHQHMAGEVAGDWGRVHRHKPAIHIHVQVIFNFFIYFGNDATTS